MGPTSERLDALQAVWEAQAQADPLWAVLSEPDKLGRRWSVENFMATGEEHVAKTLARFAELGGSLPDYDMVVDFGSGVGRLSQALADRFARVIGVDISPTMIAVARRLNRHGERVEYLLNDRPDLTLLPSGGASLVSTHITLQHVPPQAAERYIREFLRVVKPGGGVIFQLPSHYSDAYLPADRDNQPVAEHARRARIQMIDAPTTVVAGAAIDLAVEVTNVSAQTWLQSEINPLRVGNHWRPEAASAPIVNDDGRTRLPGRMKPGVPAVLNLTVRAPDTAGTYRMVVDVVQEVVSWFEAGGSPVVEVVVDVIPAPQVERVDSTAGSAPAAYGDDTFRDLINPSFAEAPMFEMNAIHRDVVTQIIADCGATLLGSDEWINEWHSFTYYVQAG